MPVKVNSQLPAVKLLEADNIFVMDEARAAKQDIRTFIILVVNLMPRKMVTETQILALLSNTPVNCGSSSCKAKIVSKSTAFCMALRT